MTNFSSYRSYWNFRQSVIHKRRYFPDRETQSFLNVLIETAGKRVDTIDKGSIVYRAQIGSDSFTHLCAIGDNEEEEITEPAPLPAARMVPLAHQASEGRANPKNLPYLYVATTPETAMAEVRPWIGSEISLGVFRIVKKLRLVNFVTEEAKFHFYLTEPNPKQREEAVWSDIDRAFAQPVERNDFTADYAPTQIIAEYFKSHDFDGISYRSSLSDGHNIALFDLNSAELSQCALHEVKSVKFDFSKVSNPYYMKDGQQIHQYISRITPVQQSNEEN